jgi:hypothetical protein
VITKEVNLVAGMITAALGEKVDEISAHYLAASIMEAVNRLPPSTPTEALPSRFTLDLERIPVTGTWCLTAPHVPGFIHVVTPGKKTLEQGLAEIPEAIQIFKKRTGQPP